MKKLILSLVALATLTTFSKASAQVFEEGNVSVDIYYGFPNLYSTAFKSLYANSGMEQDIKISGAGPVGLRGEYLLTDKVGLGLDIGFNNTTLTFSEESQEYDQSGNVVYRTYDYTYKTKKVGAMVTFNYHFIDNDAVDFYGVLGMGYGNRTFSFSSTDPNYQAESIKSIIPVAAKLGLGLRYFFTDNIGANLGLGIGQGGILNAGLSFKF